MKKYLQVLLFSVLGFVPINSQDALGPVFGVSFAKFYNTVESDGISFSYKTGGSFGIAFEKMISQNVSIQPEFRYMQMGTIENFVEPTLGTIEGEVTLNYISIPVPFKYKFGTGKSSFFIEAGPRIGFGLGDIKVSALGQSGSVSWEDAAVKKFDFGFEFGIGVGIKTNKPIIFFDLRYYLGLQNLNSGADEGDANNSNLGINAGLLFPLRTATKEE
jgi:hypothetical protein